MQWLSTGQLELEIEWFLSIAEFSRLDVDFKTLFFKRFLVEGTTVLRVHERSRSAAWAVWNNEEFLDLCRELRFADEVDVWVDGDRYASSLPRIQYPDTKLEALMVDLWDSPSSGVTDTETGEMLWIHPGCHETLGITWDKVMRCHRRLIKDLWSQEDLQKRDALLKEVGKIENFEFYSYALNGDQVVRRLMIAQEIRIEIIEGRALRVTKGVLPSSPKSREMQASTRHNQRQV